MSTAIKVMCSRCGAALSTGGLAEGRPFRCPQCRSRVEYPPAPQVRSSPSIAKKRPPFLWAALGGSALVAALLSFFLVRLLLGPAGPARVDPDPKFANLGGNDNSDSGIPDDGPTPAFQLLPKGPPAQPLDFSKSVVLKGHLPESVVVDLAYSPDGSKLASISNYREVILWNLNTQEGTVLCRPPGPNVHVSLQLGVREKHLAFSPDGKTLYSGVVGETSAWNVDTTYGRVKFGKNQHLRGDIAVSPTGRFVAVETDGHVEGVDPNRLVVCDAATGKEVARADFSDRPLHQFTRFTRDGRWLMLVQALGTLGENEPPNKRDVEASGVRLIDLTTGKVTEAGGPPPFNDVAIALPGNRFFVCEYFLLPNGDISFRKPGLWTLPPGGGPPQHQLLPAMTPAGPEQPPNENAPSGDHAVSADGKFWTYRNHEGIILVRDGATLKKVARIEEPRTDFESYILGDDSATLVAVPYRGVDADSIRVLEFDLASGAKRGEASIPIEPATLWRPVVAYTRARPHTAAVSTPDGAIVIQPLDGKTPAPKTWKLKDGAAGGTQLLTAAPRGFTPLQLKMRASLELGFRFKAGRRSHGNGAAFTPDGKQVVVSGILDDGAAGVFVFIDPKTGKQEKVVTLPRQSATPGTHFQFTSDQRYVIDDAYHVVDLKSGESTPLPDDLGGYSTDLDPSGQSLAVGTKHDGTGTPKVLEIRSIPSLELVRSGVEFFSGEAKAVKYSADGKNLAMMVLHDDKLHVLLADPATCTVKHELAKLDKGGLEAADLAFSPDGRTLAALVHAGNPFDHRVLLFDLTTKKLRYRVEGSTEPVFLARGRLLGATEIYDVGTGNLRAIVDPSEQRDGWGVQVEHVNPRCNLRACGHPNGQVTLWVASRGVKVAEFKAHPSPITAIALSPDGGTLVTVGQENRLKIWSLAQ